MRFGCDKRVEVVAEGPPPVPEAKEIRVKVPFALIVFAGMLVLSGCGLVAAPCRVASAGLKIVPVAGQVAAAPTDTCANAIDPTPTRS